MSDPKDTPPKSRRDFLATSLTAGACAAGAAMLTGPLVVLVSPALEEAAPDAAWVDLGPIDRFPEGGPATRVVLRRDERDAWLSRRGVPFGSVFVTRTGPEDFAVLSGVCTHLGCAVNTRPGGFLCPCHGATFDPDGRPMPAGAGRNNPAPRPLDALAWRLNAAGQRLSVRWQRFELNRPDKRPIGGEAEA